MPKHLENDRRIKIGEAMGSPVLVDLATYVRMQAARGEGLTEFYLSANITASNPAGRLGEKVLPFGYVRIDLDPERFRDVEKKTEKQPELIDG